MARSIEQELTDLQALSRDSESAQSQTALADALRSKINLIAARAAKIIASAGLKQLEEPLRASFHVFLDKADKGCAAKFAIATALYELACDEEDVFLRGARHVQKEPSFGKPIDAAAELRGICGLSLVRMGHREALVILTDLIMDPEAQTRILAARGMAYSGREEAALLLRMKLLAGDESSDVMVEAMNALARLQSARAIPFLERFLDGEDDELAEAAALAIASTREPAALALLKSRIENEIRPHARKMFILAIALIRREESLQYLLSLLREANLETAEHALEAMKLYKPDDATCRRIQSAVDGRGDERLRTMFLREFRSC